MFESRSERIWSTCFYHYTAVVWTTLLYVVHSMLLSFSYSVLSSSLPPLGLQHTRIPCPSLPPRVCSNSCPLSWWCYPTISSSLAPFFSCPLSFPASGSFPMSRLFALGGQNIGASASASTLPMNIQGLFPLGLTDFITLQSKGHLKVFSSTSIWKHQFSGTQPSLWSNSHIPTWLLESHSFDYKDLCGQSDISAF